MKITINSDVCVQKGLPIAELLAILLIRQNVNITQLFTDMVEKQVVIPDMFESGKFVVTQRWNRVCDNILLAKDPEVLNEKALDKLAVQMAKLFPTGIKDGTHVYWKGNKKDTIVKLQKFFKLYGTFSEEDILTATKRYVDSFNGNYQTMRVLKYFILKDNESDLATQLENLNQENQYKQDWDIELR